MSEDAHNSGYEGFFDPETVNLEPPFSFAFGTLPTGFHGQYDSLTVEDVKFLLSCGIDPIEEAPPDTRTWRPRTEVPLTDF